MATQPSLYEMLIGNFSGDLDCQHLAETDQVIMSVLDNIQRILNTRAGAVAHLPDYGLPDMSQLIQGMPGTAHSLLMALEQVLLKYEPRLKQLHVTLLPESEQGVLRYAIDAELHEAGLVRYGTEFSPEGRIIIRHLRQQQFLD
ncbi:type VI secretion system baseplate subunit TssE [Enterobacteriaceae bacterium LUAb1]